MEATTMNEFSRIDSLDLFDEFVYEDKTLIVYDKTPTKTLAYEQNNPYIEHYIPNNVAIPESDICRFYDNQII